VQEFFLATGDDENSCCFFEDLQAKRFLLVDLFELENPMTDGEDDTNGETN
jgi:hypothetical protein